MTLDSSLGTLRRSNLLRWELWVTAPSSSTTATSPCSFGALALAFPAG